MTNNDNYLMINGKKVELTEEQIKKLGLEDSKSIFDKVEREEEYYSIYADGRVLPWRMGLFPGEDKRKYLVANYCADKDVLVKRAKEEVLHRLLWRFSIENGWKDESWGSVAEKYYIFKSHITNNYSIGWSYWAETQAVYFFSREIAQRAIKEIAIPFEKGELEVCKIWDIKDEAITKEQEQELNDVLNKMNN